MFGLSSKFYVLATLLLGLQVSAQGAGGQAKAPLRPVQIEDFAPDESFIDINGLKTYFVQKGMHGPVVVLIHGFASSSDTWRFNIDELSKGHRVYAFDIKGFGLTARPRDGNYHIDAYSDQLRGFLAKMKIERAHLVGSSMGGTVAITMTLKNPELVESLILVDPAPLSYAPTPDEGVKRDAKIHRLPKPPNHQLLVQTVRLSSVFQRTLIEAALKSTYHQAEIFVTPELVDRYHRALKFDGAIEALEAMARPPQSEPLPPMSSIKKPTLIVWGRHDKIVPLKVADYFEKSLEGSRKVIFEQSGHLPHEEQSATFNRLVAEFIAERPTRSDSRTPVPANP